MSQSFRVRIPAERVGVLIGRSGSIKKKIESMCKVKLEIDSETGEVTIIGSEQIEDPTTIFKAQNIVLAIGRGFPETGGKNFSAIHVDMIKDMREGRVYADGELIYAKGKFTI